MQTTMRHLHYAPRPEDALIVDAAFAPPTPARFAAPPQDRVDASHVAASLR